MLEIIWKIIGPDVKRFLIEVGKKIWKKPWPVKFIALLGVIIVILCFSYPTYAKLALTLADESGRALIPSDALLLHERDQQKVKRVLDRLASALSAKLDSGEDRVNAWTTAQMVVAVSGLKSFNTANTDSIVKY